MGRMKSCRPGKTQSHLTICRLCTDKYISSPTHICNMKTSIAGTFQPVRDIHKGTDELSHMYKFPAEGEQGEAMLLSMLWCCELAFFPQPTYAHLIHIFVFSVDDLVLTDEKSALEWRQQPTWRTPGAPGVNVRCILDLMHISAPQSLTWAWTTDAPSFSSAVISLLSSLFSEMPTLTLGLLFSPHLLLHVCFLSLALLRTSLPWKC